MFYQKNRKRKKRFDSFYIKPSWWCEAEQIPQQLFKLRPRPYSPPRGHLWALLPLWSHADSASPCRFLPCKIPPGCWHFTVTTAAADRCCFTFIEGKKIASTWIYAYPSSLSDWEHLYNVIAQRRRTLTLQNSCVFEHMLLFQRPKPAFLQRLWLHSKRSRSILCSGDYSPLYGSLSPHKSSQVLTSPHSQYLAL